MLAFDESLISMLHPLARPQITSCKPTNGMLPANTKANRADLTGSG